MRRARHPWTLQRRLIVTIAAIVSLILILVGVATSAILGSVLERSLDSQVEATANRAATWIRPLIGSGATAADILGEQAPQPGFLLVVGDPVTGETTAAATDDRGRVVELSDAQITELVDRLDTAGPAVTALDGVGTYRLANVPASPAIVVVGISRTAVSTTIGEMLLTIALLTLGGLLLLAVATAWTVRAGLAPLRSVAETARRVAALPLDQGEVSIRDRVPDAEADPRTEIGQVGQALNTLLDHVSTSLTARQRNEERMRSFVADASHELRTPLASIRGYSELSLRALGRGHDDGAVDTAEASLERIQSQSLRMTSLVEDLLLLARLDEGQELVYGAVDLSQLAVEALGDAQAAGPEHHWVADMGEEPVVVAGDARRLHQVMANLLGNARIHTPAGTTVRVSIERDDADAVVRVHDDGPGIDPAIADELFERFSRADRSRARNTGGTGLGLSIARAIVVAHGGTLAVTSSPGDTTFEMRLPARPEDPVRTRVDGRDAAELSTR
ncbi:two-component system OmpR family sensor kinase [Microbacterium sp. SLBN-154]|uniref:sensor histidine kinase n=1 Tax=Microbacterium sp. SLBN-154 TaxID=2768458 RepID=UPI0011746925|nr:ATP-binding protein [Microbacterium sp. SLBN-154]TQK20039.1 two-component system OmpR family sensor kinase [Microbacterium sp. SLBN-154]